MSTDWQSEGAPLSTAAQHYSLDDVLYLMRRLRDPATGCPWDVQQTFATLAPFVLEEACEVIDAIEHNDHAHLCEELGDLLLQVVFQSQLAQEQSLFSFDDVVHQLAAKLLVRHPHVFPQGTLQSERGNGVLGANEATANWDRVKEQSRAATGRLDRFADIPLSLPALARAEKLQKRAARSGFDWRSVADVIAKLHEELDELDAAIVAVDPDALMEELGDVLFCCVNISRHLNLDAESALRRANNKFARRFRAMEALAVERGQDFATLEPATQEALWGRVKALERTGD